MKTASLPSKLPFPFTIILAVPAFTLFAYSIVYSLLSIALLSSTKDPNCFSVLVISEPVYSSAVVTPVPEKVAAEISAATRFNLAVVFPLTLSFPVFGSTVTSYDPFAVAVLGIVKST